MSTSFVTAIVQVNRKRHIGNDITCLVFLEGPDCHFNPLWIKSHFLYSFIVIQLLSETTDEGLPLYRVSIPYYEIYDVSNFVCEYYSNKY